MKIAFDIDGTLTDYNYFVEKYAVPFFCNKYGMKVVNEYALEIEDVFDMKNFFHTEEGNNVEDKIQKVLDKFWVGIHFLQYIFFPFRSGVKEYIKDLKKSGHLITVHTSRMKTANRNLIGKIAKIMTLLQFWGRGIFLPKKNFFFCLNDEDKLNGILKIKPELVFEDKPQVIRVLNEKNIPCICVNGKHNVNEELLVQRINDFGVNVIDHAVENTIGKNNWKIYCRLAKSDQFFNHIKLFRPVIMWLFKPLVLHKENIKSDLGYGIVFVPNHRSTLDPLIITALLNRNVHWAALLRFFEAKDSIFNNNKNPILCKLTAIIFKKLEYFPVDRQQDNPKANNFEAIRNMNLFLRAGSAIGIFGEGTIHRKEGQEFGVFDDSFFFLARKNESWIQPVTIYWSRKKNCKYKVAVNFGELFKVGKRGRREVISEFMNIQHSLLEECKKSCG